ncbi:putative lipoprotein [Aliivibrio wodanis]|uniref:Putative lipoprotein n=1 Tax=Aliivibrio wodanis TaxID=80852 RepID=A0A090ITI1_9GAMM|nr:putative lipoprotein [Aliivibrio wodanis]
MFNKIILLGFSIAALVGCNDDHISISDGGTSPSNTAPTAVISSSSSNAVASIPVYFFSTSSADAEGDALTYRWLVTSKPASSLPALTPNGQNLEVNFDVPGSYTIQLNVSDGEYETVTTQSMTVLSNIPPLTGSETVVAQVGNNQKGVIGTTVFLDGHNSYDSLGNPLTYSWIFTQRPVGSSVQLSSASDVFPSFTPDIDGTYLVELTVSSNGITSVPTTTTVAVGNNINTPPIANAGHDIVTSDFINNSNVILLDGSQSHDLDGDALTYRWEIHDKEPGSSPILVKETTSNPALTVDAVGTYELTLVVFDGSNYSQVDSVTVEQLSANTPVNHAPIAHAGLDQKSAVVNAQVSLDGSKSSDIDGDSLSYKWHISSQPASSNVALSDITSATPTFTPVVNGTYVFTLIVNDASLDSTPDSVSILVGSTTNANHVPQVSLSNNASTHPAINTAVDFFAVVTDQDATDTHTYQWSIVGSPPSSNSTISGSHGVGSLTPDISGTYTVQVIAIDSSSAPSQPATSSITVTAITPPVVLPPTHKIGLNSTLGGGGGAGALFAIDEDALKLGNDITAANSTVVYKFSGLTPLEQNPYQKFTYNPHDQKFYTQLEASGLFADGSIISFDPATDKIEVVAHVKGGTVDGHHVYGFTGSPTVHPTGKYLIANSRFGGKYNAGRVYLVNIDSTDNDYGEISWVYDLGCGNDNSGAITESGSNCTPTKLVGSDMLSYAVWGDGDDGVAGTSDDQVESYAHGDFRAVGGLPAQPIDGLPTTSGLLRLKPTDPLDLTKRWQYVAPSINFAMELPILSFAKGPNSHYITQLSMGDNGGTLFSENGGGGDIQFGCEKPLGVIYDPILHYNVGFCSGDSIQSPTLYTGASSSSISAVRTFPNNRSFTAKGFDLGSTGFGALVNYNHSVASYVIQGQKNGHYHNIQYDPAEVQSINTTTGSQTTVIQGDIARSSTLGSLFLGSATSDDSGKYVVILSLDGGNKSNGSVLKYDRDTGIVTSTSFGFDTVGYVYGKPYKHSSNGELYTAAIFSSDMRHNKGTHIRYDATHGAKEIFGNGRIEPGITFVEAGASNNIYSIGVDISQGDKPSVLYEIDATSHTFKKLFSASNNSQEISDKVLSVSSTNSDELVFAFGDSAENNVYCYDLTNVGPGYTPPFVSLEKGINHGLQGGGANNNPHDVYRGLMHSSDGAWYFVANMNGGQNEPTIQKLDNCSSMTITHVADLSNQATTMPLEVGSKIYIGTGATLVEFDSPMVQEHTLSIPNYPNIEIQGYLSELDGGLVTGVIEAKDASGSQAHFVFTYDPSLGTSSFTYSKLDSHMPLDSFYPGVIEIE